MKIALVTAAVAMLALSGCATMNSGPGTDTGDDGPVDIRGEWTFVGGTSGGEQLEISDFPLTVEFTADNARVRTGCFSFDQPLTNELDAQTIAFSNPTAMCMAITEDETRAMESLNDIDSAERDGDSLTLIGDDLLLYFELVPAVDQADVVGTWSLSSVLWGDVAASHEPGPAITFDADGTVSGSTGCGSFTGRYELVSGTNRIEGLELDDSGCPDDVQYLEGGQDIQAPVDAHVWHVLEGGFLVHLSDGTLSLVSSTAETTLVYNQAS